MLPVFVVTVVAAGFILLLTTSKSVNNSGLVLKDSDEQEDREDFGDSINEADEEDSEDHDDEDSTGEFQTEIHDDGSVETQYEYESEDGVKIKLHSNDGDERAEIRPSETERIKVRTKNGERRIDVYQGGVKVRFEYKDGEFIAKAEYEGEEDGVDVDTNSLVVTTPAGERVVTVLPDQAIANLITANTISSVVGDTIELGELDGEPVYEILGVSNQRLLGLLPVGIQKQVDVSVETGNAINISQSFLSRIMDALAF